MDVIEKRGPKSLRRLEAGAVDATFEKSLDFATPAIGSPMAFGVAQATGSLMRRITAFSQA